MNYPSKKIWILIVIGLFIVLFTLWYLGRTVTSAPTQKTGSTTSASVLIASTTSPNLLDLVRERIEETGKLGGLDESMIPPDHTVAEIKTRTVTNASRISYANEIIEALRPFTAMREHESRLVLTLADATSTEALQQLRQSQAMHEKFLKTLLAMSVPADATSTHLIVVNMTSRLNALLKLMVNTPDEPLQGLDAAYAYALELPNFFRSLLALNVYFTANNINFDQEGKATIYINLD